MTDDRRLEIERRFDGEPPEIGEPEVTVEDPDDPEARRHLDRLARLRDLARRHDPASEVPRRAFPLPERRPRPRRAWLAVAASAAAIALWFGPGIGRRKSDPVVVVERTRPVVARPAETSIDRPPLEVELYGWANTPSRAPKQAARLVLSPAAPSKKRSPADEILALELANSSPRPVGGVQRFAVAKGSKSAARPGPSSPRTKSTVPDV